MGRGYLWRLQLEYEQATVVEVLRVSVYDERGTQKVAVSNLAGP